MHHVNARKTLPQLFLAVSIFLPYALAQESIIGPVSLQSCNTCCKRVPGYDSHFEIGCASIGCLVNENSVCPGQGSNSGAGCNVGQDLRHEGHAEIDDVSYFCLESPENGAALFVSEPTNTIESCVSCCQSMGSLSENFNTAFCSSFGCKNLCVDGMDPDSCGTGLDFMTSGTSSRLGTEVQCTAEGLLTITGSPTLSPQESPTAFPTIKPTNHPTVSPVASPTEKPITNPTADPTVSPTNGPTRRPTQFPSPSPTNFPSTSPLENPTNEPTPRPTENPTFEPTREPVSPTQNPTPQPTGNPTKFPTNNPTRDPTPLPTVSPTSFPSRNPTKHPTPGPSFSPTGFPTESPNSIPTQDPTPHPTRFPSVDPTERPSSNAVSPTKGPSNSPTPQPSAFPTPLPVTSAPTGFPTVRTAAPTTASPTLFPTIRTESPTTGTPTTSPSKQTIFPTPLPTSFPVSSSPSNAPTKIPLSSPTGSSASPTGKPSFQSNSPTIDEAAGNVDFETRVPERGEDFVATIIGLVGGVVVSGGLCIFFISGTNKKPRYVNRMPPRPTTTNNTERVNMGELRTGNTSASGFQLRGMLSRSPSQQGRKSMRNSRHARFADFPASSFRKESHNSELASS